eukprot:6205075-Pleurochrysis_carterae.AAC.2
MLREVFGTSRRQDARLLTFPFLVSASSRYTKQNRLDAQDVHPLSNISSNQSRPASGTSCAELKNRHGERTPRPLKKLAKTSSFAESEAPVPCLAQDPRINPKA